MDLVLGYHPDELQRCLWKGRWTLVIDFLSILKMEIIIHRERTFSLACEVVWRSQYFPFCSQFELRIWPALRRSSQSTSLILFYSSRRPKALLDYSKMITAYWPAASSWKSPSVLGCSSSCILTFHLCFGKQPSRYQRDIWQSPSILSRSSNCFVTHHSSFIIQTPARHMTIAISTWPLTKLHRRENRLVYW